MRVKTCGAMTEQDIQIAAAADADAVGVICPSPSGAYYPRSEGSHTVDIPTALQLREATPEELDFVWLVRYSASFDKSNVSELMYMVRLLEPDRVQLGETEHNPDLTAVLAEAFDSLESPPKIAQVIHVDDSTVPEAIDAFPRAHYIHLDSAGSKHGNNGVPHNWGISRDIAAYAHEQEKLVILAGGLSIANITRAIKAVQPDELDVEGSIRENGAYYSEGLVQEFVLKAKGKTTEIHP